LGLNLGLQAAAEQVYNTINNIFFCLGFQQSDLLDYQGAISGEELSRSRIAFQTQGALAKARIREGNGSGIPVRPARYLAQNPIVAARVGDNDGWPHF
jgi:hypothetical protein